MMKETTKHIAAIMLLISFVVLALGSATSSGITLEVERPPNLDTSGIKSIAIMPFEYQLGASSELSRRTEAAVSGLFSGSGRTTYYPVNENSYREMAQHATTVVTNNIQAMNYFTLVDRTQADATLVGKITLIEIVDTENDKSKNVLGLSQFPYSRDIKIEFNYSLIRRNGGVIGPVNKTGRASANADEASSLPNDTEIMKMLRDSISRELRNLSRDLAPYTVSERRTLAKDKSKDKDLQAEMTKASDLVNTNNYNEALEIYLGVYEKYKSIAAAENASIMYEVMGNTQTAVNFMERVFNETGNADAKKILTRLKKDLQDQEAARQSKN